jgi:hypothetical protein
MPLLLGNWHEDLDTLGLFLRYVWIVAAWYRFLDDRRLVPVTTKTQQNTNNATVRIRQKEKRFYWGFPKAVKSLVKQKGVGASPFGTN